MGERVLDIEGIEKRAAKASVTYSRLFTGLDKWHPHTHAGAPEVIWGSLHDITALLDEVRRLRAEQQQALKAWAFVRAFNMRMCGGSGTEQSYAQLGEYAAKMVENIRKDSTRMRRNTALLFAADICSKRAKSFDDGSPERGEASKCAAVILSHLELTDDIEANNFDNPTLPTPEPGV